MESKKLFNTLEELLESSSFQQDCHENGWQVEGKKNISHIACAVSPTQEIIEKANILGCDALITHHGLYWKKQQVCATGVLGKRLKALFSSSLNLFSYHLPLDCHPILGNNAQIGIILGIENKTVLESIKPHGLLYTGHYNGTLIQLIDNVTKLHGNHVRAYQFSKKIENLKVSWCSGAGGDFLEKSDCDVFLTGEISERHYHIAQELGITLIQAGHWATEIWGVKALSVWIKENLNIKSTFINIYNPI